MTQTLSSTLLLPIVILAGGLATRLTPVTKTIPKSLIPIHNEPFIAHQLRLLKSNGLKSVVLCLGYLGESVTAYLKQHADFELDIRYSFDGPELLGTAGAIRQALKNNAIEHDFFFVIYGDSYLRCDYLAIQNYFFATQKPALMTVFKNTHLWDKSNITYTDGQIIAYDKIKPTQNMQYIDYGLSLFHRSVFEAVPLHQPYDLTDVLQPLLQQGELAAYEVKERFYEVGSFSGIEDLRNLITLEE